MIDMEENERTRTTGSALEKAVGILEALGEHVRALSLSELAELTTMPKQTVHRVVRQLEELGLIARETGSDRFIFGARLRQIGVSALSAPRQSLATRQILTELVAEIGETCNIGVLDGEQVLYVDRVECHWPLRVQLRPGSRVPSHCTAIGKLLLAHLPGAQRRELLPRLELAAFTRNTLVTVPDLEAALATIRGQGYAINQEEDSLGLNAMAVPVRDASGKVLAALAVHAPTARLPLDEMLARRPLLEAAAGKVAEILFGA
ncbi:Pectin degradation repressor protein KdgR [compost metagenome]|uniref:IclR family transcriptional regulator n=1 Tax=Cupriavidus campinensis TaxID=151783 RepID=A0AAE9L2R4_9BURK|nr:MULTISPECIES: IclR family transcriptional regulator [Cupriavidus]TSP12202.1 IclR family transcriptional regulator [Cupriavidus campinensis]URF06147.1 IclR family transcriptional regulator [Cupriavidus campinensis]CAG2129174.1 Pectin degradation repressor protein KdgR [Cupriavidus campinensis]